MSRETVQLTTGTVGQVVIHHADGTVTIQIASEGSEYLQERGTILQVIEDF